MDVVDGFRPIRSAALLDEKAIEQGIETGCYGDGRQTQWRCRQQWHVDEIIAFRKRHNVTRTTSDLQRHIGEATSNGRREKQYYIVSPRHGRIRHCFMCFCWLYGVSQNTAYIWATDWDQDRIRVRQQPPPLAEEDPAALFVAKELGLYFDLHGERFGDEVRLMYHTTHKELLNYLQAS